MNITYSLYLKTHIETGLMYLGKTEQDPYRYEGSGTKWRELLQEQGPEQTTDVLYQSQDYKLFCEEANKRSHELDVVNSTEFANMIHENGGWDMTGDANPNYKHGRAVGWKSNPDVQKANDKHRNAEYYDQEQIKEQARMKFAHYSKVTPHIRKAEYWWNQWYANHSFKSRNRQSLQRDHTFEQWWKKNTELKI